MATNPTLFTTEPDTITQRERVLSALQASPVCGTTLLRWHIPRYGARIHELRTEGYEITREVCRLHAHQTRQWVYIMEDRHL